MNRNPTIQNASHCSPVSHHGFVIVLFSYSHPCSPGMFLHAFLCIMCQLKMLSLDCVLFQSRANCHQKKPDHPKCQPVFASQPTWLLQYCCFHTRTPCYLSCPPAGPWGKLASTSCARTFNSFWSSDEQTSHGVCNHMFQCTQFSCAKAECKSPVSHHGFAIVLFS